VGGYPIVDDTNVNNNNSKYPVKLPSIPSKGTAGNSAGNNPPMINQPLHPSMMTIAGNPLPHVGSPGKIGAAGLGSPGHPNNLGSPRPTSSSSNIPGNYNRSSSSSNNNPTTQQLLEQTNNYQQQLSAQHHGHGHHHASNPNEDAKWLPVEDDILICMQNAIHDPNFSHTMHWLNNAKGIVLKTSRTVTQAKNRYAYLCATGKKDERLLDPNVIRTIAKLKKSIKRPIITENSDGTTSIHATSTPGGSNSTPGGSSSIVPGSVGGGNVVGVGGSGNVSSGNLNALSAQTTSNSLPTGTSSSGVVTVGGNPLPTTTPTIGMTHAIEKKN
jgi:hypothetical protein